MSIDERPKRKPEFDEASVPVEIPGHGTWYIPRPRLTFRRRRLDGKTSAVAGTNFGADYDALVSQVETAAEGTVRDFCSALFALAEDLLARNYDLTDDDLDALFEIDPKPSETGTLREPWGTIWEVAAGLPPKSSAPGSLPDS
jgi:hypothetical protein